MLHIKNATVKESIGWISGGWKLYKKRPGYWAGMTLLMFVLQLVIGWIPVVGWLAYLLVSPLYTGLLTLGGEQLKQKETFETGAVLLASVKKLPTVIAFSLLLLVFGGLLIVVPILFFGLNLPWSQLANADQKQVATILTSAFSLLTVTQMVLILLSVTLGLLIMAMGSFFGQTIIFLKSVSAKDAIVLSFKCSLMNVWPLTVWYGSLLLLSLLGLIPLGLGIFITMPLFYLSTFVLVDEVFYGGAQ